MKKLQEFLNVDGLIVGVVMEYGDWRGRINWGAVVGFSARAWSKSTPDRSCGITGRPQRSFNPTRQIRLK
jgi:hypothetical protein